MNGLFLAALDGLLQPRSLLALLIGSLLAFSGCQTVRLHRSQEAFKVAVGLLKDPQTGKTWQSEAVGAQRDLATCRGNETAMQGAIDGQNASLDALKREADAITTAATAKIRAAQADSAKARRDVAAIMAKRPGGDLCASALELLRTP